MAVARQRPEPRLHVAAVNLDGALSRSVNQRREQGYAAGILRLLIKFHVEHKFCEHAEGLWVVLTKRLC